MTSTNHKVVLSAQQLVDFFAEAFPGHEQDPEQFAVIEPGFVRIRQRPQTAQLRPGGIVSGPTQMALADRAAYAVILAHIGIVPMAVTSNLNMSFLRGVRAEDFFADAYLIKLGRRLATVDVRLWQDDESVPVAQSTVTYALPDG
ncbi:MAG: PaaI family thioesterase [Erythrobacter sp.]|uniref:PaaI family thioesterase n=1 Tax=Erythrobacter sp. TaxID=1042 RepID=UPI0026103A4C|nr:PaaI family thioesterase [Erythrobacter sp.]MDJ0977379.1 PaaI family thioesterase [Erythrobacter sp.]